MKLNSTRLGSMYPHGWNDKEGKAAKFVSQDSEYRLYKPTVTSNPDGTVLVYFEQDHIRGGTTDDHSKVSILFQDGIPCSWSAAVTMGNDGTLPTVVVDVAEILKYVVAGITGIVVAIPAGTATAALTASTGAAAPVAPAVGVMGGIVAGLVAADKGFAVASAVLGGVGATYNYLGSKIMGLTDIGGRLNFNAVVSHNINKICSCMEA